MRTGKYRVRKGWFGKCILQAEYNTPSFICGRVDSSIRQIVWEDVNYKKAPEALREAEICK